jgi:hypothetical protein
VYKQKWKRAAMSTGLGLKNIRDLDLIRCTNKRILKSQHKIKSQLPVTSSGFIFVRK